MSAPTPIFHLCRWSRWSAPVSTYNSGKKQQWRSCCICGRADFRTIRWDEMTDLNAVKSAIALARGEA